MTEVDDLSDVLRQMRQQVAWAQPELAVAAGVDPMSVSRHERGQAMRTDMLEAYVRTSGTAITLTPDGWRLFESPPPAALPCYGRVPCGHPIMIEDPPESDVNLVDLTNGVWREGRHYLLIADGDSMKGAGIRDGDWLVVERRPAKLGDIVVATLNGSTMVKRLVTDDDPGAAERVARRGELAAQRERLTDLYVSGDLTRGEYDRRRGDLDQQTARLDAQEPQARAALQVLESDIDHLLSTREGIRTIARAVVARIVVLDGQAVMPPEWLG